MSTYTTKWYPFQRALRCRFFKSFDDKGGEIDFVNHIDTEIELFLFGGEKYTEPYVAHVPYVMNTTVEIREAHNDYMSGKYGKVKHS